MVYNPAIMSSAVICVLKSKLQYSALSVLKVWHWFLNNWFPHVVDSFLTIKGAKVIGDANSLTTMQEYCPLHFYKLEIEIQ